MAATKMFLEAQHPHHPTFPTLMGGVDWRGIHFSDHNGDGSFRVNDSLLRGPHLGEPDLVLSQQDIPNQLGHKGPHKDCSWFTALSHRHHPRQQASKQRQDRGPNQRRQQLRRLPSNQLQGDLRTNGLKMDQSKHFPQIVGNGDEYLTEELYGSDYLSGLSNLSSTSPTNDYHSYVQTPPGYGVSGGRDMGPSHPDPQQHGMHSNLQEQLSNVRDQPAFNWPPFSTTPSLYFDDGCGAGFDYTHVLGQEYGNAFAHGFESRVPGPWADPGMSLIGETTAPVQHADTRGGMSFDSFSSSVGNSDAMAAMSLDTPCSLALTDAAASSMVSSYPSTVSPKVLRMNPSPAPPLSDPECEAFTSTTNLLPGHGDSDSSNACSSVFDQSYTLASHISTTGSRTKRSDNGHGSRKALPEPKTAPNSLCYPRRAKPSVPHEASQPAAHRIKHLSPLQPKPPGILLSTQNKLSNPDPISGPEILTTELASPVRLAQTAERSRKDEFLIKSKLAGMTYREIRRKGGFTEAESTLRGRFRTLTKHKDARVRKPEWNENDIRLLKKAVRKLARGPEPYENPDAATKIPWKQVAEYISGNGGSYHFGNATCRKRWDELVAQGESGQD